MKLLEKVNLAAQAEGLFESYRSNSPNKVVTYFCCSYIRRCFNKSGFLHCFTSLECLQQELSQYRHLTRDKLQRSILHDMCLILSTIESEHDDVASLVSDYLIPLRKLSFSLMSYDSIGQASSDVLERLLLDKTVLNCLESWLSFDSSKPLVWVNHFESCVSRYKMTLEAINQETPIFDRLQVYLPELVMELDTITNFRTYATSLHHKSHINTATLIEVSMKTMKQWLEPLQDANRTFLEHFLEKENSSAHNKYFSKSTLFQHFIGQERLKLFNNISWTSSVASLFETPETTWASLEDFNNSLTSVRECLLKLISSELVFDDLVSIGQVLEEKHVSTEYEINLLYSYFGAVSSNNNKKNPKSLSLSKGLITNLFFFTTFLYLT